MFPGYRMHAITNGVHPTTWVCDSLHEIYDRYVPGWSHEPELLIRVERAVPDAALWAAHVKAKQALIERVCTITGVRLEEQVPILGFARRMTGYKRPDLLFADTQRLQAIARRQPLQIVLSGKAHPHDEGGKQLIEQVHAHARALDSALRVLYLPNYDLDLARLLVAGCDIWLNTPLPPLEASGTSGMKAAFNGVPHLSILDGWWLEGCIEGQTGWAIESTSALDGDARALYDKLENVVLPLYRGRDGDRSGWLHVMKGAISINASYFNSHRMMRRYATEAHLH